MLVTCHRPWTPSRLNSDFHDILSALVFVLRSDLDKGKFLRPKHEPRGKRALP